MEGTLNPLNPPYLFGFPLSFVPEGNLSFVKRRYIILGY
jgi:hypothetical protein